MKTQTKFIFLSGLVISMFSCASNDRDAAAKEIAVQDSISAVNNLMSSSAAVEKGKDTTRKFIRTAEIKFRVKNVAATTYRIEDLVNNTGGFVIYTHLVSNSDYKTITPISADSSLETIHYTVSNEMALRVPNTKLDSTLKSVATLVDYLDYRIIKANDVALQITSNRLMQERVAKHEERLKSAIDTRGKKLNETANAEENLLDKEEQADGAKISNLSLQDQIHYSTVRLLIYQRESVKRTVIANDKNIDAYEPGFGSQFWESLKYGWDALEKCLVFIAKIWWLLVLPLAGYLLYKKFGNRFKKKD